MGLGYDPATNEALLPDYDSELVFEVDFRENDIVDVSWQQMRGIRFSGWKVWI